MRGSAATTSLIGTRCHAGCSCAGEHRSRMVRRPQPGQKDTQMEATELFRGRLIDLLQLVVRELDAIRSFYEPVPAAPGIAVGGRGETSVWAGAPFASGIH